MNFAGVQLSFSHFRLQRVEDVQRAELAFTSSASSPPSAPGVRGSQRGEDFWKVYPPQQHDVLDYIEKDHATCLTITSLVSPVDNIV